MERNEKCFCGSGKKYKICHNGIDETSKLADMHKVNLIFDKFTERQGIKNNCMPNCHACCHDYFFITENEFLLILERIIYLRKSDLGNIIEKAKHYQKVFQDRHPKEYKKLNEYMPPGRNLFESVRYFSDTAINNRELPACIMLDDNGLCAVYDNRPYVCRIFGTCQPCEYLNIEKSVSKELISLISLMEASQNIVGEGGKVIVKRPYPLFYWFSTFLDEPYKQTIMMKSEKIKALTEQEYYKLFSV